MNEREWQKRIIDTAKAYRWRVVHIRNVKLANGRYTVPYEGHPGLPDLILARNGRVLLIELKADAGKPTADQRAWLEAAGSNGRLWRPSDWDQALTDLQHPPVKAATS